MIRRLTMLAAILGALSSTACGPTFDHLDFEPLTHPPAQVVLTAEHIEIPAGIAVAVDPKAMAVDGEIDGAQISLRSEDPSVFDVDPEIDQGFVIYGIAEGEASLGVVVDGETKRGIPVTVMPPAEE